MKSLEEQLADTRAEAFEEAAKVLDAAAADARTKADEAMKDCALSPAFAAETARAPFQAAERALRIAAGAIRALKEGPRMGDIREAMPNSTWPAMMSLALAEVLGMPNFRCSPFAHLYRAAGHDIPPKAEDEQAFVLHRFIGFVLEHGAEWKKVAHKDLEAAQRAALERQDKSEKSEGEV